MKRAIIFAFLALSACNGCLEDEYAGWEVEEATVPDSDVETVVAPEREPRREDDVCARALDALHETYPDEFSPERYAGAVRLSFTFDDRPAGGLVERCWVYGLNEAGQSVFSLEYTRDEQIVSARVSDTVHPLTGRLSHVRSDRDGDGTWDYQTRQTFDPASNVTTSEEDLDGDGVLDRTSRWLHDARGNTVESETDVGADGSIDSRSWWTYDDLNRVTYQEGDWDADGAIDSTATYEYFGDQYLVTSFRAERFEDGEAFLEIGTVEYDDLGREISTESDRDGDGQIDDRSWAVWDETDRATRKFDFDMDGRADGIYEEQWVEIAGVRRVTYLSDDWDADGVLDQERFQEYDAYGRHRSFRMVVDGALVWHQWHERREL